MKRSTDKFLNVEHNQQNSEQRKSNYLLISTLNVNSNLKLPTLNQLIEDWKQTKIPKQNKTDESLFAHSSNIEQLQEYIQYLTNKINWLEISLSDLIKRHMEICLVLQNQVQKRDTKNDILLKENNDLRKELQNVIEQVKYIANQFALKNDDKRRIKRPMLSHNKSKLNFKQNQAPQSGTNLKDQRINKINIVQSKSLPRTQLSKMRLKKSSSLLKLKQQSRSPDLKEKNRLFHIKQQYYYKSDHRIKEKLLTERSQTKFIYRAQ